MSEQTAVKTYAYEEALAKSLEYFDGDELAAKVFVDKYALRDNENNILENSPDNCLRRISKEIARIEKNKFKKPLTEEEVYEYLKDFKRIVPQGSPLSGIGNPYQYVSISNCFVLPAPLDSYSSILKTDAELIFVSKRRGGCGIDISNLRPNGSPTTNAARSSTGIIPFMERYSNSIREVGQNSRRGALIITISVHHPEIMNFITSKADKTKITGANISVRLTDEFMKAVENDTEYELRWPVDSANPKISKQIKAKEVWDLLIKMATEHAEPGLLIWNNILKESLPDCYKDFGFETVGVNPCAELILSAYDSCRLLLLNSYSYVEHPFTNKAYFNCEKFFNDAKIAQRFMDDFIDIEAECIDRIIAKIERDPEPNNIKRDEIEMWTKMKHYCLSGRRTGTGINAIGDTMAALGIKYGSDESIEAIDQIYKTLKLGCYRSSIDMAKELGPFQIWNHNLEKNNPFLLRIKEEDPSIWEEMKKYGRRNIACLTTAPSGSVSNLTRTSSGIEPVYKLVYKRRKKINPNDANARVDFKDGNGDCWQEFQILHPKVKEWSRITGETDITKSPWYGCCAEEIDWLNRVKIQATANKNVCHSISSTINLPSDASVETVSSIYMQAWKSGVKGITVYRQGSRDGVLVDKDCNCRPDKICKSNAPKRPESLPCDIYHIKIKDEAYFVIVGLFNGEEPYEIFAGKNKNMKTEIKKGFIKKVKRGRYALCNENEECHMIYDDVNKFINEEQEAITRMISSNLRHGTPIQFLAHQLEKIEGDMQGFCKAIVRVLKKYIKDGTKVTGEVCSKCGGDLIREDGCSICKSCGWSKCS